MASAGENFAAEVVHASPGEWPVPSIGRLVARPGVARLSRPVRSAEIDGFAAMPAAERRTPVVGPAAG